MANITMQANRIFKAPNRSKCRYIVMKGSAGSGKSVDTAQHYIIRLMQDKGRNLLAMRKTNESNRDSTFAELVGAIERMGVGQYWKIRTTPLHLRCVNGNTIIFRGMKDLSQTEKVKSITVTNGSLTDVWLEEATEFLKHDIDIVDDRLRGILPEGLFYQMRFTFNPVSALHWIKSSYFDKPDPDVFTHSSTYLDNRFCDAEYHKRMMRRKETDPEGYEVYGLGNWGETAGLILNNWESKAISLNHEDYDGVSIGQDFGFNHANALLEIASKDGDIYILREIYKREMDTEELIKVADKEKFSKTKFMYCDSAEPDRIKMWRKAGYMAMKAKKAPGSVAAQIDWLKGRKIYIHPECINTLAEVQQWRWKLDEKSGLYTDTPVSFNDDAMAALRYGVDEWRLKPTQRVTTVYM